MCRNRNSAITMAIFKLNFIHKYWRAVYFHTWKPPAKCCFLRTLVHKCQWSHGAGKPIHIYNKESVLQLKDTLSMNTDSFVFLFLVCLFVCLFVFPLENEFFTHMETSPVPLKGCKCWPMLGTHGHILSVPHLQWHERSVYNGHLRWPSTFPSIAERLAVALSLPIFTT